jgi:hypothetical protein
MLPGAPPDFPTPDEVLAIAAREDAAIRNLWITWSYHRLNRAMRVLVGDCDLTWCGFATWASKTAGRFIREEELGPLLERWVDASTERAGTLRTLAARLCGVHHADPADEGGAARPSPPSGFSLRSFAREVVGDIGRLIGDGNRDVFRHIAPPFARVLELWAREGPAVPDASRQAFLDTLRDQGDQDQGSYLLDAFTAMFAAAASSEARTRAQLILQANALIGCAEQTRVQPFVSQSLNVPIEDLFKQRLRSHLEDRFGSLLGRLLHALLAPFGRALEAEFRHLSTELTMRLELPGQALRLGLDVPPLADGRMYPESLDSLDAPTPLQLLEQLKATNAAGSAASDWAVYAQRMRYIAVLFRSRQQTLDLWNAPFTDTQVQALNEGRKPEGPL